MAATKHAYTGQWAKISCLKGNIELGSCLAVLLVRMCSQKQVVMSTSACSKSQPHLLRLQHKAYAVNLDVI